MPAWSGSGKNPVLDCRQSLPHVCSHGLSLMPVHIEKLWMSLPLLTAAHGGLTHVTSSKPDHLPEVVTLGIRASTHEFGGKTNIQSTMSPKILTAERKKFIGRCENSMFIYNLFLEVN